MIYPQTYERKVGFDIVRSRVADLCSSTLGKEQVEAMTFSTDFEFVSTELKRVGEMLSIINGPLPMPMRNLHNMTAALHRCRIVGASITLDELLRLSQSLQAITDVCRFFAKVEENTGGNDFPYPNLRKLIEPMAQFPEIINRINRIIDPLGNVRDNASPLLAQIRTDLSRVSNSINSIMRKVISQAVQQGYLEQDAAPTMRDGRLVLPVAPMHKRKINGIVHDESATGKTFFIEPSEIVEANNHVRELEVEMRHEIQRILNEFTDSIRPQIDDMLASYHIMGLLDFILAKANYAKITNASLPHLSKSPELEWYHAQHPILQETLNRQNKEVVPLDITLSPTNRILVISGPNAGGKSVCLKTVGVIQYMMQCGLLPPLYENSHMGFFKNLFIDIGDNQSIEDDLSTYSSHLRNMKMLLANADKNTLLLIDEFGSGTEPQIGGALAQAILQEINNEKAWGVITTHYQNLKTIAESTPGLINGSMLYDRQLMQPLFKLSIGNAGSSFAIEIARKIGLPSKIIDNAAEIVGSDYINMDKYLLDIARDRRYWENKRLQIRQKEKQIDQVLDRYQQEADNLKSKRREIIDEAKIEAQKILEGSNAAIERTIREIKEANADKQRTQLARQQFATEKEQLIHSSEKSHKLLDRIPKKRKKQPQPTEPTPIKKSITAPLAIGDNVKLDGQGTPGKILDIEGKNAIVAFGQLKTTVALSRLKRTMSKPQSGAQAASFVSVATTNQLRDKQLKFNREIDVRGMRADEAIQAVMYFIDDAITFSQDEVRILHGTGTGALRQAIRQYLATAAGVASYRDEHVQFGGAGITVVSLR